MFHVILVRPEIPPNTGNAIRLSANTGMQLHLVRPLGFELQDKLLRRAGLDYHEWASLQVHDSLPQALHATGAPPERCFIIETQASRSLYEQRFAPGDVFVFGCETRGLNAQEMALLPESQWLRLPMRAGQRSLNLSNAVAVSVFEAWRQCGFAGAG